MEREQRAVVLKGQADPWAVPSTSFPAPRPHLAVDIRAAFARADSAKAQHRDELSTVEAELAQTNSAVDRYLTAFETGGLPEATCFERVRTLGQRVEELRRRRDSLTDALEDQPKAPSAADFSALRERITTAIRDGAVPARKALLRALVHEVTVRSRDEIVPVFRVPVGDADAQVRAETDLVARPTTIRTLNRWSRVRTSSSLSTTRRTGATATSSASGSGGNAARHEGGVRQHGSEGLAWPRSWRGLVS